MKNESIKRPLNKGTFLVLSIVGLAVLATNLAAVVAIVVITVDGRPPPAILGALAMAGFDRLIVLGERAFRWTRGVEDNDESGDK